MIIYTNEKCNFLKACGFSIKEEDTCQTMDAAFHNVSQFFEHCEAIIEEAGSIQDAMESFAPLTKRQKMMMATYFFNSQKWEFYKDMVKVFGLPPEGLCWDEEGRPPKIISGFTFDLQNITKIATFNEKGLNAFLEVGGLLWPQEPTSVPGHSLMNDFEQTLSLVLENKMSSMPEPPSVKNALQKLSALLFKEFSEGRVYEDVLKNEVFGSLALFSEEWSDVMLDQELLSRNHINKAMNLISRNEYYIENQVRWSFLEVQPHLLEKWVSRVIKNEHEYENHTSIAQKNREFIIHLPKPCRQMIKENYTEWFYGIAYNLDGQTIDVLEDKENKIVLDMQKEQNEILQLEMLNYFHKLRNEEKCSEKQTVLYYRLVLKAAETICKKSDHPRIGNVCMEDYFSSEEAMKDIENMYDSNCATQYAKHIFDELNAIDSQHSDANECDYDPYVEREEVLFAKAYVLREEGFVNKTWEEVKQDADHVTQKLMDRLMRMTTKNLVEWDAIKREEKWNHFGPLLDFLEKKDLQERLSKNVRALKKSEPKPASGLNFRF